MDALEFTNDDYVHVVRETRVVAIKIEDELDLSIYQPTYDEDNRCIKLLVFKPLVLNAPRCKPSSAPDAGSSSVVSEDGPFEKLTEIQWKAKDPPMSEDEARDDPTSGKEE